MGIDFLAAVFLQTLHYVQQIPAESFDVPEDYE